MKPLNPGYETDHFKMVITHNGETYITEACVVLKPELMAMNAFATATFGPVYRVVKTGDGPENTSLHLESNLTYEQEHEILLAEQDQIAERCADFLVKHGYATRG